MENPTELVILIAEDDEGHAELIKEGLADVGICNTILRFVNGAEVWDYLSARSKADKETARGAYYLLLLDINMPVMDGVELLRKIKGSAEFKEIPVIMLTTTDDPREVEECYRLGCNFYVTKPVDFKQFAETLKRLGLFIQIVKI